MQQLTAAASSLARFQQTAFSTSENPASSMNSAPSSSPIPLPPASSLLSLSALPLISPPSTIRQTSSYSPPSHTATPQSLPPLNLPRLQDTQHSSVHLPRLHSADNLPFTSSTNQTSASSTGRRYTNPPPPSLHAHLTHQSLRHSHQSVAHSGIDSPPPASVPKLTPSRWDEFNDPRCCAGYFDCRRAAEGSDHDRSDYDSDDDMEGSAGNVSPTSSNASGGSQIVPLTSDVRSMKE